MDGELEEVKRNAAATVDNMSRTILAIQKEMKNDTLDRLVLTIFQHELDTIVQVKERFTSVLRCKTMDEASQYEQEGDALLTRVDQLITLRSEYWRRRVMVPKGRNASTLTRLYKKRVDEVMK